MDIEISKEVNHLLKMLNFIFAKHNMDILVGVDKKVSYNDDENLIIVTAEYLLYEASLKDVSKIFSLVAKVNPEYFFDIESTFEADFNDSLYLEILTHTDIASTNTTKFKIGKN